MNSSRPLFWQQGLFLQPQHFQLLERSFYDQLGPVNQLIVPYFWGSVKLDIQKSQLGNKILQLQSGSFIFPDGAHVQYPGNTVMNGRSFDESWAGPLNVYVGLKIWSDSAANVTIVDNLEDIANVTTRFVATPDSEEMNDLHAGGPPARVKKLHYVLKLLWEDELQQAGDYLTMQIAQLQRVGAEVKLFADYIPPCPTISGSESLLNVIGEIRDQITARGRQLEEFKRKRRVRFPRYGLYYGASVAQPLCAASASLSANAANSSLDGLRGPTPARRRAELFFRARQCAGRIYGGAELFAAIHPHRPLGLLLGHSKYDFTSAR